MNTDIYFFNLIYVILYKKYIYYLNIIKIWIIFKTINNRQCRRVTVKNRIETKQKQNFPNGFVQMWTKLSTLPFYMSADIFI